MKLESFLLVVCIGCSASAGTPARGQDDAGGAAAPGTQLPAALTRTFSQLVAAIEKGETGEIGRLSLPNAVTITSQPRETNEEYGQDINLPFARTKFSRAIQHVRPDGDCCWLIRTNTSAFHFVQIGKRWLLYRYLDKPIQ